jgi:hypothetical protein
MSLIFYYIFPQQDPIDMGNMMYIGGLLAYWIYVLLYLSWFLSSGLMPVAFLHRAQY